MRPVIALNPRDVCVDGVEVQQRLEGEGYVVIWTTDPSSVLVEFPEPTQRERIATALLAGMAAHGGASYGPQEAAVRTEAALRDADILIEALNKEQTR